MWDKVVELSWQSIGQLVLQSPPVKIGASFGGKAGASESWHRGASRK
jgi:hypothetical protein